MVLVVACGMCKVCVCVCVCFVLGFVVLEKMFVLFLSMGFVVVCLRWDCVECGGGSALCVRVGNFCGKMFMVWVLLKCCL